MPERIQRKRTKGWRMPAGAVYVGRPSKWGNPFRVGRTHWVFGKIEFVNSRARAVELYRVRGADWNEATGTALRGKDLVCWCPLDQPCHADVLLEWANGEAIPPGHAPAPGEGRSSAGMPRHFASETNYGRPGR